MIYRFASAITICLSISTGAVHSQSTLPWSNDISHSQLDPGGHDPARDPSADLYFGNFSTTTPRVTHGGLVERDVLVRGNDPLHPDAPGAVLKYTSRFTHASLLAGTATTAYAPKGEQEIVYVISGAGIVTAGDEAFRITAGSVIFAPVGQSFSLRAGEDTALEMYIIAEPVPDGFIPIRSLIVRHEEDIPFRTSTAHWVDIERKLIGHEDGLAVIQSLLTVQLQPSSFSQPHSHEEGVEEVWCVIEGDAHVLIGSQIRELGPGDAYMTPPNGRTPHANFNADNRPVKFLCFSNSGSDSQTP